MSRVVDVYKRTSGCDVEGNWDEYAAMSVMHIYAYKKVGRMISSVQYDLWTNRAVDAKMPAKKFLYRRLLLSRSPPPLLPSTD